MCMADSRLEAERKRNEEQFADVVAAIRLHGEDLVRLPNVVAVAPGFRFRDGKITDDPAVVVEVAKKSPVSELSSFTIIPRRLGNVLVDVVLADPVRQLRFYEDPAGAWRISTALPGDEPATGELAFEAIAKAGKLLPYKPPAEPLKEVNEPMTVIAHSSCDTGFRNLGAFLDRTKTRLVSTMYQFTAPHILERLLNAVTPANRTFTFVFDGFPEGPSPGALTPDQVRGELENALGKRLRFAWAANASLSKHVTAGFFPSAYHIKVSVRDGKETWLSSGNWKRSSQPPEDPFHPPPNFDPVEFEKNQNREWHVVIENETLAGQFERYILHDLEQALPLQVKELAKAEEAQKMMPDLFVAAPKAATPKFEEELVVHDTLRVMPLLTPDAGSYFDFLCNMVAGAKKRILLTNQTLRPSSALQAYMEKLYLVLSDKSRDPAIELKMILGIHKQREMLEEMQSYRFSLDKDIVRFLHGNHTKGLIVDDELVLIGSQNLTGDGASRNRDASVVFWDSRIIAFYKKLFDYDWNRARKPDELGPPPMIAPSGVPEPPGMMRVPWSAVIQD